MIDRRRRAVEYVARGLVPRVITQVRQGEEIELPRGGRAVLYPEGALVCRFADLSGVPQALHVMPVPPFAERR